MSCAAESFWRPLSPRTFWHNRSNVKNPNRSCTQVWWRVLVIGPVSCLPPAKQSACWYLSQRQASLTYHLSWSIERAWEVSVKGQVRAVGATFCSINHNVLGRVGVSWFYQSGLTSSLSAWPRTPSPTAHAGLYFSPLFFFVVCLIRCCITGHVSMHAMSVYKCVRNIWLKYAVNHNPQYIRWWIQQLLGVISCLQVTDLFIFDFFFFFHPT